MSRKKLNRRRRSPSLLPRGKKQRREVEFMGGGAFVLFALVIALLFAASSMQRLAMRSPQVAAVVSATLVQLANQDRTNNGLTSLTVNPVLVAAAQAKANDMATHGYFAHVSPQGVDPWHWFSVAGYNFSYAGENLAVDFTDSGDVNTAWMNSPTHRQNILDPHYTEIGIATAQGVYEGRPTTFVVQEFGAPSSAAAPEPVVAERVPASPTTPAVATTRVAANAPEQVLGSSAETLPVPSAAVATTEPTLAASLATEASSHLPWWAPFVGFPSDTLRIAYYLIAALVIGGLALDTGFEVHWHHRRHAMRAGALLVTMSILFVVSQLWFFAPPVIAATAAALPL